MDCMTNIQAIVKTSVAESQWFPVNNGVPQGSSLSPGLFVSTLGFAIDHAQMTLNTIHKEYADDLLNLVTQSKDIIPVLLNNSSALDIIGSKLEYAKTEVYHIDKNGNEKIYGIRDPNLSNIALDSAFEDIFVPKTQKTLRYLGDHLGLSSSGIKIRISKANQTFGRLYKHGPAVNYRNKD